MICIVSRNLKTKTKIMSVCDNKRDWRIPIPPRSRQPTRAAEDLKMFLYNILFVWFLWLFLWLLLDDAFSFSLCCALKKNMSVCDTKRDCPHSDPAKIMPAHEGGWRSENVFVENPVCVISVAVVVAVVKRCFFF